MLHMEKMSIELGEFALHEVDLEVPQGDYGFIAQYADPASTDCWSAVTADVPVTPSAPRSAAQPAQRTRRNPRGERDDLRAVAERNA